MIDRVKSMRAGYVIGILFSLFGPVFLGISYYSVVNSGKYSPYALMLGVAFSVLGAFVLVFPGSKHTVNDYPDRQVKMSLFWQNAPLLHKIAWVVGVLVAAAVYSYIHAWLRGEDFI